MNEINGNNRVLTNKEELNKTEVQKEEKASNPLTDKFKEILDYSTKEWAELLEDKDSKGTAKKHYIYYETGKGLFKSDRQIIKAEGIQKLNFHEISGLTKIIIENEAAKGTSEFTHASKLGEIIQAKVLHIDRKQREKGLLGKIEDIFYKIINGFTRQTTLSKATEVAKQVWELGQKHAPVYEYTNTFQKHADVIPSSREDFVGKGLSGVVYGHKDKEKNSVVKEFIHHNEKDRREYDIGRQLDHPTLVKMEKLYIEKNSEGKEIGYVIVQEKIIGKSLSNIFKYFKEYNEYMEELKSEYQIKKITEDAYNKEKNAYEKPKLIKDTDVKNMLEQVKKSCLHVFSKGIYWGDVNAQNIFLTDKNDLKICDYGAWHEEKDVRIRTQKLIEESKHIVNWVLECSSLKQSVIQHDWKNDFDTKLKTLEGVSDNGQLERELEAFLSEQFDKAIQAFKSVTKTL